MIKDDFQNLTKDIGKRGAYYQAGHGFTSLRIKC